MLTYIIHFHPTYKKKIHFSTNKKLNKKMNMKRNREDDKEIEALAMADCLMLLSRIVQTSTTNSSLERVYECKSCSRKFPSFQALGGHRASHKRPKLVAGDDHDNNLPRLPLKTKTHECTICGVEFAIGQALGGHMRKHRGDHTNEEGKIVHTAMPVSVLKRSNSKRVMCFDLDLNLTPYENDLKFGYQMFTPFF